MPAKAMRLQSFGLYKLLKYRILVNTFVLLDMGYRKYFTRDGYWIWSIKNILQESRLQIPPS
jgi:hypothetical protein